MVRKLALLVTICCVYSNIAQATNPLATETSDLKPGQTKTDDQNAILVRWQEILGKDAQSHHITWSQAVLKFENIQRLHQHHLLQQLSAMRDKEKSIRLAAHAAEIFTENMSEPEQALIIAEASITVRPWYEIDQIGKIYEVLLPKNLSGWIQAVLIKGVLNSLRSWSEVKEIRAACKHLFTEKMDAYDQGLIIIEALKSFRPLPNVRKMGEKNKSLFTQDMDGNQQALVIVHTFDLLDADIEDILTGYQRQLRINSGTTSATHAFRYITEKAKNMPQVAWHTLASADHN